MKTFLSQAEVCGEKAFKLGLVDPYQIHKRIWETLPHDPSATRDFLFRSDVSNGAVRIVLLSGRIPISNCNMQWRTTELSPTFLSHGVYRFRLRANPARRCKTYDLERGETKHRRFALLGENEVRDWFLRKFSDAGCEIRRIEEGSEILDLETTTPKRIHFSKGAHNKGVIYSADASGTILVRDEIAFRKAFDAGIGPAKGFGFGLLMLQPVNL